jgi:hypothetical protein
LLTRWFRLPPQRVVAFLALALALVLCALVAYDLQRDYEQRFSAASSRIGSMNKLLEEHARQTMRRVQLDLSLAAQSVQGESGAVNAATGTQLRAYLPQDGLLTQSSELKQKATTSAVFLSHVFMRLGSGFARFC